MAETVMIKMVSPGAGGRAWEIGPRHWAAHGETAPITGDYRCLPSVPFRASKADADWFLDKANDNVRGNRSFALAGAAPTPSGPDPMSAKAAPSAPEPEKRSAETPSSGKASKGSGA